MNTEDSFGRPSALESLKRAIATGTANAGIASPAEIQLAVSATGEINQTTVAFNVFANLMASDGVRAALYSVLRKSNYRFISIFRFRGGKATSAVHVDRTDLSASQAGEVADTATYCCYVRDSASSFATADASSDPRTSAHPAKDVVRSYVGVPILTPEGELLGTLCHYDLVPQDPRQLDVELLLQVSSALAQSGQVPPYPDLPSSAA